MTRGLVLLCCAALAACSVADQEELAQVERDPVAFAADIQAFVGPGCASIDCHGDRGRPLRLYAEFGWRAAPQLRGTPITAEEIADNVAAFATMPAARVLGKPLDEGAGGMKHVGGDLWQTSSDPAYACMQAWLDGAADSSACAAAAAEAPY